MVKSKIFIVGEKENDLATLEETAYLTESVLQKLLSNYPDLLPGDQINPENPRRWLLVAQEMGVPGDLSETGRWSLDHLFLDQEGIPTFVECKRAIDTRIRREVVAQMLDYAANGIEYWSIERLIIAAANTAQKRGKLLDNEIRTLLGEEQEDEVSIEKYWEQVETNLRNRKVRLIFVADSTPKELRRLVEFLNEEMRNVEVLAVEVKQFQQEDGSGQKALVPRVVGFTETARSTKASTVSRSGTIAPDEFFKQCRLEVGEFYKRVLKHAEERGYIIEWGTSSFSVRARFSGRKYLATFAYGFPQEFHFYFWDYFRHNSQPFREKLLTFGVFREAGQWTLKAELTAKILPRMDEAFEAILEYMDELARTRKRG